MRIPILTYQSMHIDGNDYCANDLIVLASDLRQLTDSGFKIVPLRRSIAGDYFADSAIAFYDSTGMSGNME